MILSTSKQSDSTLRLLAICGIISPLLWTFLVYSLGAVYPNYDHVLQYMSELGAIGSPVAGLFNLLGFGLSGILGLVFVYGLYRGGAGKIGSALWAIAYLTIIWMGIWPVGPGLTLQMHRWGAYALMVVWALALFAFSVSMKRSERWKNLWRYTLFFAVFGLIALIVHLAGVWIYVIPEHGLTQRIWANGYLLWGLIMAVKLYRISQS